MSWTPESSSQWEALSTWHAPYDPQHGPLALAFAVPQHDFRDVLEPLFDAVAATVRLDPWRPGPAAEQARAPGVTT